MMAAVVLQEDASADTEDVQPLGDRAGVPILKVLLGVGILLGLAVFAFAMQKRHASA